MRRNAPWSGSKLNRELCLERYLRVSKPVFSDLSASRGCQQEQGGARQGHFPPLMAFFRRFLF
jgi:hypothetical protein